MRIKKGFVLRRMCGEHVVTADSWSKSISINW